MLFPVHLQIRAELKKLSPADFPHGARGRSSMPTLPISKLCTCNARATSCSSRNHGKHLLDHQRAPAGKLPLAHRFRKHEETK